ncbi:MAG: fasciclin domain-containing protein [Planctomycetia bacterium]
MNVMRFGCVMAVVGLGYAVAAGPVVAAPCKGSQKAVVQHGHVVQPAVIHERVISSTVVREVALAQIPADIVDTAVGAGTFKTLAAALGAADLVATLKGAGPFTVFAPTDEAFAKLPAGTVETLLKPENKEKLKEILLLHVVPGSVLAADVVKLKEAKTAGGKTVIISTDGGVKVGTATGMANVVKTDIKAKNGVIHVIDAVILP